MKKVSRASLAVLIAAAVALPSGIVTKLQAQQFEVATIKPSSPQEGENSYGSTNARKVRLVNTPLRDWVKRGFSVSDYALKAPAWLATSRFELEALLPSDKPANLKDQAAMMRSLLVERFGLKWHEEIQMVSGFELVPDKKVLVTPASLLDQLFGGGGSFGPTSAQGTNVSMAEFADVLGKSLGRPVVDRTQLSGVFTIKLMWRASDDAELARQQHYAKQAGYDFDSLPGSASDALREKCGLRLQSAKVPVKVIVVDSINRQPTGN